MTTYFRDFADGISDFTEIVIGSNATDPAWSVVNTNQLQATSASAHNEMLSWDDVASDGDNDDVETLGQIYVDSTSTTQRWFCFRAAGTLTGNKTGYAVRVRTASIDLYKFTGATFTQIATTSITITSGTWCWVRFRMNGSDIMARYWEDGGSENTGSWHVSQSSETTYQQTGYVGPLKGANTNTQLWRYFGVGTNGDTAPSSAPASGVTTGARNLLLLATG